MAKTPVQTAPERSESITVSTEDGRGNALLAAWQGVYNLFGGQANFVVTSEGVIAENFSVLAPYDPNQIVEDISHRNRRLDFLDVYPWVQGQAPEPYTDAKQITAWAVQFLRGAVEENSSRTPKYVRDATASYKMDQGFAKRRGPRKKIFRVDNLSEINPETLSGIDPVELAKLKSAIETAMASAANTTGEGSTSNEDATPNTEAAVTA